ncbi:MAG: DNA-3-methyladenine glycosylase [Cyanobacteria bacterium P01_D01_bin.14]
MGNRVEKRPTYGDAIARLSDTDSALAQLIEQVGPCGLSDSQQTGDLLYCLTRTIVHQQLSIKAAASIHRRFLEVFGGEPPSPDQILATAEDRLRSAGLSRPKVRYVKDLAQKITDLPTLFDLQGLTNDEIVTQLTQVKGIGRWSVQMLLIFRLHRWDVWPNEDLGVQNGLQRLYELDERPDKKQTDALGDPWTPYRSIAAWYLWRSLDMDQWG